MYGVPEEAIGIGRLHSVAKYGIGEIVGRPGEVLEISSTPPRGRRILAAALFTTMGR